MNRRFPLPAFFLALALALAAPARADVWGFEDQYGIITLSDKKLTDDYVLIHEGDEDPKLSFAAMKKIIRAKGGRIQEQDKTWRKQALASPTRSRHRGGYPRIIKDEAMLSIIRSTAERYGLDPKLVYAMIEQESGFNANAVSHKGAEGMMQIMPETQALLGLKEPFDPALNIDAGARYMKSLLEKYQDVDLALAAYNAGPEAVDNYSGVPPYAETQNYVARISKRYKTMDDI